MLIQDRRNLLQATAAGVFLMWMHAAPAFAETYVGGGLGVSIPQDVDQSIDTPLSTLTRDNLDADNSLAYGFKVGHFFDEVSWFGIELDYYERDPDIQKQAVTMQAFTKPAGPTVAIPQQFEVQVNHMRTLGVMAMFKATDAMVKKYFFNRLEPFVGAGMAINQMDVDQVQIFNAAGGLLAQRNINQTSTRLDPIFTAGMNVRIMEHLKAYGEIKYTSADFKVTHAGTDFNFDYSDITPMVGVKYVF